MHANLHDLGAKRASLAIIAKQTQGNHANLANQICNQGLQAAKSSGELPVVVRAGRFFNERVASGESSARPVEYRTGGNSDKMSKLCLLVEGVWWPLVGGAHSLQTWQGWSCCDLV